ncbi:MAG: type II toxin-antitoxin system VapC family toxin [Alphaproteobacteria bacterium]|nr:type II toxin-antitoxin system VapC family toxin [Alphaproteobacteria bacterium]
MYKAVIDASALLAFLKDESTPLEELESLLPKSVISSVNACEVATVMCRLGMPLEAINGLINENVREIIPFDQQLALSAAGLWEATKVYGLSLADRACIALGQKMQLPIYTADKIWNKLKLDNVEIKRIR